MSASERPSGRQIHRRDVRRLIVFPFVLATALAFALIVFALAIFGESREVGMRALSHILTTLFLICPLLICQFGVLMVVVMVVYGMNKAHHGTQKPLERLEQWTEKWAARTKYATDNANQRIISWSSRIEPILSLMRFFDANTESPKENRDGTTPK